MSGTKYIYQGNRDGSHTTSGLVYTTPGEDKPQGTEYEIGKPPEVRIGDEITLSASERDRLAPYFILTDKDGEDVGEGLTAPTNTDPSARLVPEGQTSGTEDTLGEQSSPSATSKKS
jgi:hypothetical protein